MRMKVNGEELLVKSEKLTSRDEFERNGVYLSLQQIPFSLQIFRFESLNARGITFYRLTVFKGPPCFPNDGSKFEDVNVYKLTDQERKQIEEAIREC